ncbi:zinc finger protein 729-like isoform X2 [Pectinophora gossypiella]|uniref:zinc finger protein 729-like isoform X2 n=1 Tax=Pectinophora gossypiella TaxID=13191 RepID=UPI00214E7E75|nr:zinc finger protein 729-like isoform X2 [Pectinophora gossypiella]
MDKCRICLGYKKNCLSIFISDKDTQYVEMVRSLTNIKILKDDGITDKICRACRKGLRDSYEFKLLIERSNAALNDNAKLKKFQFNNINDIKLEIDVDSKPNMTKCEDFKEYFTEGVFELNYNNTVIKRPSATNNVGFGQPVPVLEFLKSIKEDPDDDGCADNIDDYIADDWAADNYDPTDEDDHNIPLALRKKKNTKTKYKKHATKKKYIDMDYVPDDYDPNDGDDDYIPSALQKNKNCKSKNKKQATNKRIGSQKKTDKSDEGVVKLNIKPVYLKDLKLIYTCPVKNKEKSDKKRKCYQKLEMCPYCGLMTKTLKPHLLQHTGERSFKCEDCGKGFFAAKHLIKHRKIHSGTREFKCDLCTAAFNIRPSLINHLKYRHSTERNFICDICNRGFKRSYALKRHRMMHNSASKTVMCDQCNMSFYNKYGLQHHMRIHTGERPYKCEICSQPYSYKHDFNRHCFKKHGVFLKRRSVYVMNEEVLKQEKILMRDLMLRVHGLLKDDKPLNPFDGPQAALAFEQAVKALETKQIVVDFQI